MLLLLSIFNFMKGVLHVDMCIKEHWYMLAYIIWVYNLPFNSVHGFLGKHFHFYEDKSINPFL